MAISNYLNELVSQKNALVENLNENGLIGRH